MLKDGEEAFAPVGGDGQAVDGAKEGQGFVEMRLSLDQGQERRVVHGLLVFLDRREFRRALEKPGEGIGSREGFYVVPLFRSQGGAAEMLQDVVVKGLVGQARVNQDTVTVVNDDL